MEAPEGTDARASVPSSSRTSTSTVGLPRESRISRPNTSMMTLIECLLVGCFLLRPAPCTRPYGQMIPCPHRHVRTSGRTAICVCARSRRLGQLHVSERVGQWHTSDHRGDRLRRRWRRRSPWPNTRLRMEAIARKVPLLPQERLSRQPIRQPKRVSCDSPATRCADLLRRHNNGRPWRPRAYRPFGTCPRTAE